MESISKGENYHTHGYLDTTRFVELPYTFTQPLSFLGIEDSEVALIIKDKI